MSSSKLAVNIEASSREKSLLAGLRLASPAAGEEIVISGMAGRFPDSDDVHEFRDNLFSRVDLVSCDSRRWEPTHPEIPQRTGKINKVDKFDAGFFGVHQRQANSMDPMCRVLIERAFEAVIDAGINPRELRGSKTGVFVGACFSETEKASFYELLDHQSYGITGCTRSMLAQRISYWFQLQGPSFVCDTACSSSLFAVEHAYKALRDGKCTTAIVGGCNLCLHPIVSLQFARLGVLSVDGACKSFDNSANGYARSEAVSTIVLQRSKDARRIYAEILHSKTNCDGFKEQGITYPSGKIQKVLLDEFYGEVGVAPSSLTFVEAHGTGTKVGDPEELGTLDEVFCTGRNRPLHIGSVKSNIGHNEPVSGLCSVVKVVIGMETGFLPPNINYKVPRVGVEALEKGRMKVVAEKTPMPDDNGLIGINSFGFGGANSHLLLRWNRKVKVNEGRPKDNLPRLICLSGRTEAAVMSFFDDLRSRPLDADCVGLLQGIFKLDIPGNFYRGHMVMSKQGVLSSSVKHFDGHVDELNWVFSDIEALWPRYGLQLFNLPVFAAHIQRIHTIFTEKCLNMVICDVITDYNKDDIRHRIIGTVAVQTGLVEVLRAVHLDADYLTGTGIGELAAGYAAGALSLEETLMAAWYTAQVLTSTSGNSNKEQTLLRHLKGVLPATIPNKPKWSTSLNELPSIKYFSKTLLHQKPEINEVSQAARHAVILQIGGQCNAHGVQLLDESHDTIQALLEGLGCLYGLGYDLALGELYPEIKWPVARGTPMLSPLIKWDHEKNWFVTIYKADDKTKSGHRVIEAGIRDDEWQFVKGHLIDGRQLFPATGYLSLVWETLAMMIGKLTSDMSMVFEGVKFNRACTMPSKGRLKLIIMIQKKSGYFEIIESGAAVVTGRIYEDKNIADQWTNLPIPVDQLHEIKMTPKDIYKELRLRGYNYRDQFRALKECDIDATKGLIAWTGNWIPFMDNMLQMRILKEDTRNLYVPVRIDKVLVNAKKHLECAQAYGENPEIPVYVYEDLNIIRSGGIEIRGLWSSSIVKRKQAEPVLETYGFVPNEAEFDVATSVRVLLQLALENEAAIKIKAVELMDELTAADAEPLCPLILSALADQPLIQPEMILITKRELELDGVTVEDKKISMESDCYMVVGSDLMKRVDLRRTILAALKPNGYILSRERIGFKPSNFKSDDVTVMATHRTPDETLVLACKKSPLVRKSCGINLTDGDWLQKLQVAIKGDAAVVLYAQNDATSGILGLTNCIRREPGGDKVRCVFVADGDAPEFGLESEYYAQQMAKGLAVNVLKYGVWGSYRHLLVEKDSKEVRSEHCYVNVTVRGDLSSLRWIEGPLRSDSVLGPEELLVHVYCTSINFRDVMTASGRIQSDVVTRNRLEQDCVQGFEYAGRDPSGRRVMGMLTHNAMATLVAADTNLLWDIPSEWSMEEAVTIPAVYGTVLYGLIKRAHLRCGQSILIHSATGGVGQAAVNVALHHGCTVFVTCGTPEKRDFIRRHYPRIKPSHIGNSRDTSFEEMVRKATGGRGVDLVLNSLADEKLQASVRCLAPGGQFLEIGKFDLASDTSLPLDLVARGASFHGIMLDALFLTDPRTKRSITDLLTEGIREGYVKPLPRTCFKSTEIEQAFRYMATGKHIGKVMIRVRREEEERNVLPVVRKFSGVPRFFCNPSKSYVIVGGLGGFGLELADWLVLRGARKLILASRKGVTTGYQTSRINIWKSYGATVLVSDHDVTTRDGAVNLLADASAIGPVSAIFNLAAVLKDGLLENQTAETFATSMAPKSTATAYLDAASRSSCPDLDHFVVFSSVSCGRGNAGQTNYGLANSIMERICEERHRVGLPALAIQWGAVGDVGLVAEMQEEHTELVIGGTLQQRVASCLERLDRFLRQSHPIVGSMVVAEKKSGGDSSDNIVDAVVNILGLRDLKTVSHHSTFPELGMDSMMAVEIKQTLEREYEVFLTPQDIRSMTFSRLQEIAEAKTLDSDETTEDLPKGVKLLLRFIAPEGESETPLVRMQSAVEATEEAGKILLLPGVEGTATVFETLATSLKGHVFCAQFSETNQEDSILEMAANVFENLKPHLLPTERFTIVAHSFGAAVGLELTNILEQNGHKGVLILIDGSPTLLKNMIEMQMEVGTDAVFETSLLCTLLNVYLPFDIIAKLKPSLLQCASLDERIKFILSIPNSGIPHSPQYVEQVCKGAYKRIKAIYHYEASFSKLASSVALCRPVSSTVLDMAEDYDVSVLTTAPVQVKFFEGNHLTIVDNTEVADEINSWLETDSMQRKIVDGEVMTGVVTKHGVM